MVMTVLATHPRRTLSREHRSWGLILGAEREDRATVETAWVLAKEGTRTSSSTRVSRAEVPISLPGCEQRPGGDKSRGRQRSHPHGKAQKQPILSRPFWGREPRAVVSLSVNRTEPCYMSKHANWRSGFERKSVPGPSPTRWVSCGVLPTVPRAPGFGLAARLCPWTAELGARAGAAIQASVQGAWAALSWTRPCLPLGEGLRAQDTFLSLPPSQTRLSGHGSPFK